MQVRQARGVDQSNTDDVAHFAEIVNHYLFSQNKGPKYVVASCKEQKLEYSLLFLLGT